MNRDRTVFALLATLASVDLVLTVWGFVFPRVWFQFLHASPYIDPAGLLRRCAANWLAFLVIQILAIARWRAQRWWLVLVAGCRLGDALTDVTCLAFCTHATVFAMVAFPAAAVGNLASGVALVRAFVSRASESPPPHAG